VINPTFSDVLTVYHQQKQLDAETNRNITKWIRSVFNECYFGVSNVESLNGTTLSQASSYIARIPYKGKALEIAPGDIVVLGSVNDEVIDAQGKRTTDLIAKYKPNCFTVRTFKDNTKIIHSAHYKLIGA